MTRPSQRGADRLDRRVVLAGVAGAIGMTALSRAARAQAAPLRALLAAAPTEAMGRQEREIFRFLDLEALRSLGADAPQERTVLAWPIGFDEAQLKAHAWPRLVGFARGDVAQLLQVGAAGRNGLVLLAGRFDAGAIGAALTARGFAANATRSGAAAVWSLRDDDELGDPVPGDPLGNGNGSPARVALLSGRLAAAISDAGIALAVDAASGQAATFADVDTVSVLATAAEIDLGDGSRLVQAFACMARALGPIDTMAALSDAGAAQPAEPPLALLRANPLPEFAVALFGERRGTAGVTSFVAVPYDDEDLARTAANALVARVAGFFVLGDAARSNLVARAGGAVVPRVVATRDGHVALAAATTRGALAGANESLFAIWIREAGRLGFWPLWQ